MIKFKMNSIKSTVLQIDFRLLTRSLSELIVKFLENVDLWSHCKRSTTAATGQWSEAFPWSSQFRAIQALITVAPASTMT